MNTKLLTLIAATVFIAACSNLEVYEAAQENLKLRCLKLPETQYDECMERANKSYDEYSRERKIVVESPAN